MAAVIVREMTKPDRPAWALMRQALWPEASEEAHSLETGEILDSKDAWGFIAKIAGAPAPAPLNLAPGVTGLVTPCSVKSPATWRYFHSWFRCALP